MNTTNDPKAENETVRKAALILATYAVKHGDSGVKNIQALLKSAIAGLQAHKSKTMPPHEAPQQGEQVNESAKQFIRNTIKEVLKEKRLR